MNTIGSIILAVFFTIIFTLLLSSPDDNPERWEHVDVQQINSSGEAVETWADAKILSVDTRNGIWCRFRTKEGREVTLATPYRFLYR